MATLSRGNARVWEGSPQGADHGMAIALGVADLTLAGAFRAIEELRATLDEATRRHAEVATYLTQSMMRAGQCEACGRWIVPRPPTVRATARAAVPPAPSSVANLAPREMEVLRLLGAGHSSRRIAQALFLSPRTVQRYVANIYSKIGAHRRAGTTACAIRHGLARPTVLRRCVSNARPAPELHTPRRRITYFGGWRLPRCRPMLGEVGG